jgi:pyocin large subunit-like protein
MIWKNLGFQAAAVAAIVAVIAFVVPLPGERTNSPAGSIVTAVHDTSAGSVQRPSPPAVQDTNTGPIEDTRPASDAGFPPRQHAIPPLWSSGPEHDAQENAAHHWQKHGSEFRELHSERDYTNAAHDFVNHPPPGAETKHDSRGNTLIYDPDSNTFAVKAPDGAPRTMFRPHNGRVYWDRQH